MHIHFDRLTHDYKFSYLFRGRIVLLLSPFKIGLWKKSCNVVKDNRVIKDLKLKIL